MVIKGGVVKKYSPPARPNHFIVNVFSLNCKSYQFIQSPNFGLNCKLPKYFNCTALFGFRQLFRELSLLLFQQMSFNKISKNQNLHLSLNNFKIKYT